MESQETLRPNTKCVCMQGTCMLTLKFWRKILFFVKVKQERFFTFVAKLYIALPANLANTFRVVSPPSKELLFERLFSLL